MSGALIPAKARLLANPSRNDLGSFSRDDSSDDDEHGSYFRPTALNNRLTVSFAPDGTSIFNHESSLFKSFRGLLGAQAMEETILSAFKIWAREGNLDAGVVTDSGDAFGAAGRTYGDERFGDIRIGAFPMATDVYAIALGQGDFVSGTWAGDILFNSNAKFKDAQHFFAVALHEVGHSLGLNHSNDPKSVMHESSTRTDLSAADKVEFQTLYGIRTLDGNDSERSNNDTPENATELKFTDEFTPRGIYPSVVYGDVSSGLDVDYFELEVSPASYTGSITFQLVSDGISLLAPRIEVFSDGGELIASAQSDNIRGDLLTLSISDVDRDEKMFIRVTGNSPADSGSYSLVTTLDDRVVVSNDTILQVARNAEFVFLEQDDIAQYFFDPASYLFNDDDHSDDDQGSAFELETEDGFGLLTRFRRNASLLDSSDIDVYKLKTLPVDTASPNPVLNVSIRSVDIGGMIPFATVLDDQGNTLSSNVLVNGLGEFVVQIENFEADTEYFIHVSSSKFLPFQNGNYELTVSYSEVAVKFDELASGTIGNFGGDDTKFGKAYHSLHIAESQIFQFALDAQSVRQRQDVVVWATVYDQDGLIVHQAATKIGTRQTGRSVYLSPGSYTVEIETRSLSGDPIRTPRGIRYDLSGINVGDGQGPDFNDPTDSPFEKNGNGEYVYPDDVLTASTFVFVDGISSNQQDPPVDDPPANLFNWYWGL